MSSLQNLEDPSSSGPDQPEEQEAYHCDYCDAVFPKTREGALQKGRHVTTQHGDKVKQERAVGLRPPRQEAPPEGEVFDEEKNLLQTMVPREFVAQYGELGIAKLRRARLSKLIGIAPDITGKTRTWVMENYDSDETAKKDPNALNALLEHSGVSVKTAQRITAIIAGLDSELRGYLPTEQPYYGPPPVQQSGRQYYPYPRSPGEQALFSRPPPMPYYPYAQPAYYPPPPQDPVFPRSAEKGLTLQDVTKVVTEALSDKQQKDKLTLLSDGMTNIMERMNELTDRLEKGEFGGKKEEPWEKAFKATQDELKKVHESLTEKERGGKTSEAREEIKSLRDEISKLSQDLVTKESDRKLEAMKGELQGDIKELKGLMSNVSSSGKVVEGYKSDEFRLLGQGLEHAVKKEPVRIVIEGAEKILYGPRPPTKVVEQGADLDSMLGPDMTVEK